MNEHVVAEYEDGFFIEKPDPSKPLEECCFVQVAGPYKREETARRRLEIIERLNGTPEAYRCT